jgi:hypothetical protein
MSIKLAVLGIIILIMIFDLILFVFFGEKTVRKLRKNPTTRDALGIELISGWDIVNVMSALSLPRTLTRKFRETIFSSLDADAELLFTYTTKFDRVLARVLYISMASAVFALFILILLDKIGIVA